MDPLHVRHMDIYAYLLMREKKTVELQRLVCHRLVSITLDLQPCNYQLSKSIVQGIKLLSCKYKQFAVE